MASTIKVEGNRIIEEHAVPEGEKPQASVWTFADPGQALKHSPQFVRDGGLTKGDIEALADAANEERKQRES